MFIKRFFAVVTCVPLFLATGTIFLSGSKLNTISSVVAGVHTSQCHWNHYDRVEPTISEHGSKEFWACCSHLSFSLSLPSEGSITDMGPFSGDYFYNLDPSDDRYLSPLTGLAANEIYLGNGSLGPVLDCEANVMDTEGYFTYPVELRNSGSKEGVDQSQLAIIMGNFVAGSLLTNEAEYLGIADGLAKFKMPDANVAHTCLFKVSASGLEDRFVTLYVTPRGGEPIGVGKIVLNPHDFGRTLVPTSAFTSIGDHTHSFDGYWVYGDNPIRETVYAYDANGYICDTAEIEFQGIDVFYSSTAVAVKKIPAYSKYQAVFEIGATQSGHAVYSLGYPDQTDDSQFAIWIYTKVLEQSNDVEFVALESGTSEIIGEPLSISFSVRASGENAFSSFPSETGYSVNIEDQSIATVLSIRSRLPCHTFSDQYTRRFDINLRFNKKGNTKITVMNTANGLAISSDLICADSIVEYAFPIYSEEQEALLMDVVENYQKTITDHDAVFFLKEKTEYCYESILTSQNIDVVYTDTATHAAWKANLYKIEEEQLTAFTEVSKEAAKLDAYYGYPLAIGDTSIAFYDSNVFSAQEAAGSLQSILAKAKNAGKKVYFDMMNGWIGASAIWMGGGSFSLDNDSQAAMDFAEEGPTRQGVESVIAVLKNLLSQYSTTLMLSSSQDDIYQGFATGNIAYAITTGNLSINNVSPSVLPKLDCDGVEHEMEAFYNSKMLSVTKKAERNEIALQDSMAFAQFLAERTDDLFVPFAPYNYCSSIIQSFESCENKNNTIERTIYEMTVNNRLHPMQVPSNYWDTFALFWH